MDVRVITSELDPWREIQQYQASQPELRGKVGATSVFIGTMRDMNQGKAVQQMTLEHYPGMTERHLQKVASESLQRWDVLDVLLVHRVGTLKPDDPIVLVAVWSAHRGEAFDACRYVIDELKTRAPFWKQEQTPEGSRWVQQSD